MVTLNQLAANDPDARKQLIDKAEQMLKVDPNNFTADYYITTWGPAVGGSNPTPDLLSEVDAAAHGMLDNVDKQFAPDKKPPDPAPISGRRQRRSQPRWRTTHLPGRIQPRRIPPGLKSNIRRV